MKRILVAYDGGEPAHRALETALDLTSQYGGELGVVSVVPYRPGRVAMDPWDDPEEHARQLAEAQATARDRGIEPRLFERTGDPARTIESIAIEGGYDTIVLGTRGLNEVERFLQGSVSEHVATHARTTVVITR